MLEIAGEAHAVRGDAGLAHEIIQEPPIGPRKGFTRRARREAQLADRFLLIDQRQAGQVRSLRQPLSTIFSGEWTCLRAEKFDRGVGQPQSLGHRFDNRRQNRVWRQRVFQSSTEL